MESVSSYYKEEPYFPPSDRYLEPQAWLSYDEQQRLLRYHNRQNKRGLSYANRSTPLHDLSRLPHTPERQDDFGAPENGVNTEVFYDDGTYGYPTSQISAEWTYRRPGDQNGGYRQDVNYNGNRPVSSRRLKSKESASKTFGHYEHSPSWDGKTQGLDYDPFLVDGRRQNFKPRCDMSSEIIEGPPSSPVLSACYYDVYRDTARFPASGNSSMWHPWSDISRPLERSVAMSPSSPLDSGLSSQSVASTPSSELEPLVNWDQPPADGFDDGLQKPYSDSCNGRQWSCPSEMYTVPLQTAPQHSNNYRLNPNRTFYHPSARNCLDNLHSPPNRGMHQPDATSAFGEMSPNKKAEVHSKCYSSAESVSDSYELRNGSWTLLPEKRERGNKDDYYSADKVDSDNQFDRIRTHHCSSTSDGTSESTLKESSANCNLVSPEFKSIGESGAPDRTSTEHLRQEIHLELPSKDAELLYQKQRIKNAKKAEKALCELEEIYNQLNLDDFDLLDRAERRDLPTAHQLMGGDSYKSQPLTRSKSDTFYEIFGRAYGIGYSKSPRAPPLRRAGIPDRIADDMALRKQQKPVTKFGKPVSSPSSYLLYSSHFTPSIPPVVKDFPFVNKPDVEYDDFSYRKYFQPRAYHELRQPPFGIPVHPIVQCPNSNYLHATPSSTPRALCHARGNPDIVRDDMAFRNLRKESTTLCSR